MQLSEQFSTHIPSDWPWSPQINRKGCERKRGQRRTNEGSLGKDRRWKRGRCGESEQMIVTQGFVFWANSFFSSLYKCQWGLFSLLQTVAGDMQPSTLEWFQTQTLNILFLFSYSSHFHKMWFQPFFLFVRYTILSNHCCHLFPCLFFVCLCVYVFLWLCRKLLVQYHCCEDILGSPHNFKDMFEGLERLGLDWG